MKVGLQFSYLLSICRDTGRNVFPMAPKGTDLETFTIPIIQG